MRCTSEFCGEKARRGGYPTKMAAVGAQEFVPDTKRLATLAGAARDCRGCELYRDADQTVFGAGPASAAVMLVGEQPGDQEDRAGAPFVGPAGRLLDKALSSAGVNRDDVYVTNAVKHFKFSRAAGSKRRIHQTPTRTEVVACRPWLFAELLSVQPDVLVLLGSTAAKSLLGNDFRVTQHRGEDLALPDETAHQIPNVDPHVVVTVHPSAVLRGPSERREQAFNDLVADLRVAAKAARSVRLRSGEKGYVQASGRGFYSGQGPRPKRQERQAVRGLAQKGNE
jgi:uracil-DNA glycosylase